MRSSVFILLTEGESDMCISDAFDECLAPPVHWLVFLSDAACVGRHGSMVAAMPIRPIVPSSTSSRG